MKLKFDISQYFYTLLLAFTLVSVKPAIAQVNPKHQKILQTADSIFKMGDYINSKAYYQYFTRLYPEHEFAKARLDESINLIRSEREQRIVYANFIIKADDLYQDEELDEAILAYQEALKLFSFETYPAKQIRKIKNQIEENKLIREEFESVIKIADAYFSEEAYKNAKIEYQFAISLLPKEEYPKNKLSEVDKLIADEAFMFGIYRQTLAKADSLFANKNYELALGNYQKASNLLPKEDCPKNQISQIKLLLSPLEAYNELLEKADNFYMVRDYISAKNLYQKAIDTKPNDSYPAEMLTKVNEAIANKATTDQEDYENAVAQGDTYLASKQYTEAKNQFEFANRIRPNDKYSIQKLQELEEILNAIQAAEALMKEYNSLISKADVLFTANELEKAESTYQQANNLKPDASYPLEKLREIKNIFKTLEDQKNLDQNYSNAIAKADEFLASKNYVSAKAEFELATRLKADEAYPKAKIKEIDSVLELMNAQQLAEENFNLTIAKADALFDEKKYANAQMEYKKALNYKADAEHPNNRLTQIADIFAQQQEELDRAYQSAISNAQNEIAKNQLLAAKVFLNEALSLKPDETYPAITILQIDTQIEESKARALLQYEPLLKEADQYFNQKAYDRALSYYYQASALLPNEIYPKTMINDIVQIIKDANQRIILDSELMLTNNEIKKYNFEPIPITDRKSNYFLLKLNNVDDARNFKIIFNYGKDNTKNGGLIIRLNKTTESNYYLIRVGGLYKWFSQDNNWVSIQSEGGQLSLSELSISKII